jgi:hypothetical protein
VIAERWNGTSWSVLGNPTPAGSSASHLAAVSCISASACTAVGTVTTGIRGTLVERWNGTAWSTQSTPNPSSFSNALTGVSCASASNCVATGYGLSTTNIYTPMTELWNGTSWALQPVPLPSGATYSILAAVSCASTSSCVAAGYWEGNGTRSPMAEVWNGTSWSLQSVPAPAGAEYTSLNGVSCSSASNCVATGAYTVDGSDYQTLAERWDGSSWSIMDTVDLGTDDTLGAVSCTSATACTAVGSQETGPLHYVPIAEAWNGSTWTNQPMPVPTGATATAPGGVSCTAASVCTAVGYALTPNYSQYAEGINGTAWALQATPSL